VRAPRAAGCLELGRNGRAGLAGHEPCPWVRADLPGLRERSLYTAGSGVTLCVLLLILWIRIVQSDVD
jgi:hypothetical protein